MKRMLFNATQAEELRVAIVDGQKLIDLDIESANKEERKSNIYKALITRIEPSLEAAFVDYGAERHGFLPLKEIAHSYFQPGTGKNAGIRDVLREGQELIVQVEKDERGNKGAALTTYVSLAGRYLVLMPNNPRGGGVSRRIEGDDRSELRETMDQLEAPHGMSLIARTAAIGRSVEELQWDLNYLLQLWSAIEGAAREQSGAFLIYQEGSLVIRAIRDYFQPDIGEILIDTDDIFEQARQFMGHVMPGSINRIKRYHDDVPLFSRFQIEHQIESAYSRQVNLPSGGAVVIDHTEALVAIDVNSGRATKGADIEETALRTNLEAAEEIARQLCLRDLGGLIVIDFIDMESSKNQREVENRLRDALRYDRARVQTGKISRFGLLELSRQRLRPALAETSYITCPRCTGTGHIRSTESSALHILRILEEEAMKENTGAVHLQVPVDVATYLLNEKRVDIARVEFRHKIQLIIVPNRHMETPAHEITRLRHDQLNQEDIALASYQMVQDPTEELPAANGRDGDKPTRKEAVIKGIGPSQPAPEPRPAARDEQAAHGGGVITRLTGWFSGLFGGNTRSEEPEAAHSVAATREPRERGGRGGNRNGERRAGGARNGRTARGEREETRESRTERPEKGDAATHEKQHRQPKARGERAERQERAPRTSGETPERAAEADTARSANARRRRNRDKTPEDANKLAPPAAAQNDVDALEAPAPKPRRRDPAEAQIEATQADAVTVDETPAASGETEAAPEKRRRRSRGARRTRSAEGEAIASAAPETDTGGAAEALPVAASEPFDAPPAALISAAPAAALGESFEPAAATPVPLPLRKETDSFTGADTPAFVAETPVLIPQPPVLPPQPSQKEPESAPPSPKRGTRGAGRNTPPVETPAADLSDTLQNVGLVMIETSSEKKASASDAIPGEPVRRGRKPRPLTVIADEPLQQVETQKDA
ncbi:MAG: Rne/Rng family ribonuclease [Azoarcus sp.]|jgi:ribonuclease E|nr:Rne/Rng family ribonuclease [Azoarcus sp.]